MEFSFFLVIVAAVVWYVWKVMYSDNEPARTSPRNVVAAEEETSSEYESFQKQTPAPVVIIETKPHEPEIIIKYRAASGAETTRGLSEMRYSNSYYFHAFCHLRQAERTFYYVSILEAYDARTGDRLREIVVRWGKNGRIRRHKL